MAIAKTTQTQPLDLNNAGQQVQWDVSLASTATVQLDAPTGGTAVVTLYRSLTGFAWHALEDGGVTLGPGDAMTAAFDVNEFTYLAARVTTAEGSALTGEVTLCAVREV